jgi:hypothetical protein
LKKIRKINWFFNKKKIKEQNKDLQLKWYRSLFSFCLVIVFLVLPLKLLSYFQIGNFSYLEQNIINHSKSALDNLVHAGAAASKLDLAAAQLALNCGADDMGSVMIEENVVSSAGANFRLNPTQMQQVIREAGFEPWLRNQDYTPRQLAD